MRRHQTFYFGWVAVEAAGDIHVFQAVGDFQVAVLVKHADVAGVQPAVGVDGFGGFIRVVEITLHHVVAAYHYFACLAGGQRLVFGVDNA